MPKKILIFFAMGIAWTFILSIPVGQGKTFFDLAHYYLVDSRPVHWVIGQFSDTVSKTKSAGETFSENYQDASERTSNWYQRSKDSLAQQERTGD